MVVITIWSGCLCQGAYFPVKIQQQFKLLVHVLKLISSQLDQLIYLIQYNMGVYTSPLPPRAKYSIIQACLMGTSPLYLRYWSIGVCQQSKIGRSDSDLIRSTPSFLRFTARVSPFGASMAERKRNDSAEEFHIASFVKPPRCEGACSTSLTHCS